jgi:hypothetical protein
MFNISANPSCIFYVKHRIQVTWYIASKFMHEAYGTSSDRQGSKLQNPLSYFPVITVKIIVFKCTHKQSQLTVLAGILPWQWMQSVVHPISITTCSSPQPQWINITSHRLITVLLTAYVFEGNIECKLSFEDMDKNKLKPSKTELNVSQQNNYSGDVVWHYPDYHTFYVPTETVMTTTLLILTIERFEYFGSLFNIKENIIMEFNADFQHVNGLKVDLPNGKYSTYNVFEQMRSHLY